jgi:hypothetical protein
MVVGFRSLAQLRHFVYAGAFACFFVAGDSFQLLRLGAYLMLSKPRCWLLVPMVLSCGLAAGQVTLQPAADQRKRWMDVYSEEAAKYQIFRRSEEIEELELVPTPVLTFTNPVRVRDTHGAAYVWTSDGRPEVLGAIWSVISPADSTKRHLSLEFHSLSLVPIYSKHERRTSRRGVVPDWTANEAGIDRKKIPDARTPVTSANLRLTQMRRLAQRFQAKIPPDVTDGQGSLRLLTQPLYRYRSESHRVIDGGLFAFVMGTDPELILLIEAVESQGGPEWQFAAAQFTNLPLRLDYQDTQIWECQPGTPYVGDRPHFLYWAVSDRDRVIQ